MRYLAVALWSAVAGACITLALHRPPGAEAGKSAVTAEQLDQIYRQGWLAGADWAEHVSGEADAHRRGFDAGCQLQFGLAEMEMAARCRECQAVGKVG